MAILIIWLVVVIFTSARHEFWRDEVRALSLVRAATSPVDLYGLIQYDGHPVLWYLLLYLGTSIVDTPLVLPITSIAVAFAAVALFVLAAPFPVWMRCLFIFSALPLYEYSVMARNYGISMLLLLLAAVAYRDRARHPIRLGLVLALLANTNVHSAMLVCLIGATWAWDTVADARKNAGGARSRSLYLAFGIVTAGVLLCVVFAAPREKTILTSVRRSLSVREIAGASLHALLRPDQTFPDLVPESMPAPAAIVAFYLAVLGLSRRPNLFLAALGALGAFGMFFRVAYPGSYRHQGLFLLFLVFLYWVYVEARDRQAESVSGRTLFTAGLYAGMLTLIVSNVAESRHLVLADIRLERSSSKALGRFLSHSAEYRDAIIVPEPDYMMESLPYYADNLIYLPRERRFGKTVTWTTDSHARLTLGEMLSRARELERQHEGRRVLVVLAWNLDRQPAGQKTSMYGKVFSWTAHELADFRQSTSLVAELAASYGDENYKVYALE